MSPCLQSHIAGRWLGQQAAGSLHSAINGRKGGKGGKGQGGKGQQSGGKRNGGKRRQAEARVRSQYS